MEQVYKQVLVPLLQGSGSEERPDSPSDCLDDHKKTERLSGARKELVCQVRLTVGLELMLNDDLRSN